MEPIDVGNIKSERMTPSMEVLTIDEDVEGVTLVLPSRLFMFNKYWRILALS